jgi:uncharacterized protein YuzE
MDTLKLKLKGLEKFLRFIGPVKLRDIGKSEGMRIKYDPEADVLLLILREDPPADAIEEPGGIIVSYGEDGEPVSVEFLNASVRHDGYQ